jgi:hypothetical protein
MRDGIIPQNFAKQWCGIPQSRAGFLRDGMRDYPTKFRKTMVRDPAIPGGISLKIFTGRDRYGLGYFRKIPRGSHPAPISRTNEYYNLKIICFLKQLTFGGKKPFPFPRCVAGCNGYINKFFVIIFIYLYMFLYFSCKFSIYRRVHPSLSTVSLSRTG